MCHQPHVTEICVTEVDSYVYYIQDMVYELLEM